MTFEELLKRHQFKPNHPITCLNETEWHDVQYYSAESPPSGKIWVRDDKCMWFRADQCEWRINHASS